MGSLTQRAEVSTLEQDAREELAAIAPELLDDDAWGDARENLLRLFALMEAFTAPEDETVENEFSDRLRGSITR
jgi:hypothetical protein